jgi:hypothetical protein
MDDQRATKVAMQHADGWTASYGVGRSLQRRRCESSASDTDLTSSEPTDEVHGPGETRMSTPMPRVESIVRSLHLRLGEGFDFAVIAAEVEAELSTYAHARVTQFIPILVESRVWQRLRQHLSA